MPVKAKGFHTQNQGGKKWYACHEMQSAPHASQKPADAAPATAAAATDGPSTAADNEATDSEAELEDERLLNGTWDDSQHLLHRADHI